MAAAAVALPPGLPAAPSSPLAGEEDAYETAAKKLLRHASEIAQLLHEVQVQISRDRDRLSVTRAPKKREEPEAVGEHSGRERGPGPAPATSPAVSETRQTRPTSATGGTRPEAETLGDYSGRIKSFSMSNGFGFIECDELKKQGYQNDVFLHYSQLREFQVDSLVRFNVFFNARNQPQAKDLTPAKENEQGEEALPASPKQSEQVEASPSSLQSAVEAACAAIAAVSPASPTVTTPTSKEAPSAQVAATASATAAAAAAAAAANAAVSPQPQRQAQQLPKAPPPPPPCEPWMIGQEDALTDLPSDLSAAEDGVLPPPPPPGQPPRSRTRPPEPPPRPTRPPPGQSSEDEAVGPRSAAGTVGSDHASSVGASFEDTPLEANQRAVRPEDCDTSDARFARDRVVEEHQRPVRGHQADDTDAPLPARQAAAKAPPAGLVDHLESPAMSSAEPCLAKAPPPGIADPANIGPNAPLLGWEDPSVSSTSAPRAEPSQAPVSQPRAKAAPACLLEAPESKKSLDHDFADSATLSSSASMGNSQHQRVKAPPSGIADAPMFAAKAMPASASCPAQPPSKSSPAELQGVKAKPPSAPTYGNVPKDVPHPSSSQSSSSRVKAPPQSYVKSSASDIIESSNSEPASRGLSVKEPPVTRVDAPAMQVEAAEQDLLDLQWSPDCSDAKQSPKAPPSIFSESQSTAVKDPERATSSMQPGQEDAVSSSAQSRTVKEPPRPPYSDGLSIPSDSDSVGMHAPKMPPANVVDSIHLSPPGCPGDPKKPPAKASSRVKAPPQIVGGPLKSPPPNIKMPPASAEKASGKHPPPPLPTACAPSSRKAPPPPVPAEPAPPAVPQKAPPSLPFNAEGAFAPVKSPPQALSKSAHPGITNQTPHQ